MADCKMGSACGQLRRVGSCLGCRWRRGLDRRARHKITRADKHQRRCELFFGRGDIPHSESFVPVVIRVARLKRQIERLQVTGMASARIWSETVCETGPMNVVLLGRDRSSKHSN